MITTENIERRCRRFLARRGLRVHKVQGNSEPVYYIYEDGGDDAIPEDDRAFMRLDELCNYCGELEEQELAEKEA